MSGKGGGPGKRGGNKEARFITSDRAVGGEVGEEMAAKGFIRVFLI